MTRRTPNPREAALLAALRDGERYGLELRDAYEAATGAGLPLGSLYTTLNRMEAKGYVRSRTGASEAARGGNRRRWFRITAAGVRALDAYTVAARARLRMLEGTA